jgi:hypothetical protein
MTGVASPKREASLRDEALTDAEHPRAGRLVQIETARIVTRQHPERLDRHAAAGRHSKIGAAIGAVRIVDHRDQQIDEQGIAADA